MTITSNQPLGEKTVLVEVDESFFLVERVFIDGYEVEPEWFAESTLEMWSKDIRREYEAELASAEEYALELAAEDAADARAWS